MDIKDIEAYKKEMMKLYSKGKPAEQAESSDEISAAESKMAEEFTAEKENNVPAEYQNRGQKKSENGEKDYDDKDYADAEHDTSYYPYTADEEEAELERIIYGDDLSDIERLDEQDSTAPTELGNSTGFILVNVRAGNEATPIVGASVVVTAIDNGKRLLAAVGITDISGTVTGIEVPAPDKAYSLTPDTEVRPYSLFDISVRAKGFFNARSIDVPVFSGITSVQNFNMVPLPIGSAEGEETLTYLNSGQFS
ncbi:MAG: hypothetical protein IKV85_05215 [Ruminococcus sp.]|nr:hypothetical protein [Ruminococcus sp.]